MRRETLYFPRGVCVCVCVLYYSTKTSTWGCSLIRPNSPQNLKRKDLQKNPKRESRRLSDTRAEVFLQEVGQRTSKWILKKKFLFLKNRCQEHPTAGWVSWGTRVPLFPHVHHPWKSTGRKDPEEWVHSDLSITCPLATCLLTTHSLAKKKKKKIKISFCN